MDQVFSARPAEPYRIGRRGVLQGMALLGLSGCAAPAAGPILAPLAPGRGDPGLRLAPLRARPDRIFDISVCIRPFRPAAFV